MDARTLLRHTDYEWYLIGVMLPPSLREEAWAVLAVAAELATVPQKTREPLAGAMRLAWWREQLQALAQGAPPPEHPLLQAVRPAMAAGRLPWSQWERLIAAHGAALEAGGVWTAEALDAMAREATAPCLHLLAALAGEYAVDMPWRESLGELYGGWRMLQAPQMPPQMREAWRNRLTEAHRAWKRQGGQRDAESRRRGRYLRPVAAMCAVHAASARPSGHAGGLPLRLLVRLLLTKW